MKALFLTLGLTLAGSAIAEPFELTFTADLDGNGIDNMAVIYRGDGDDMGSLTIFEDGEYIVHVPDFLWVGGIGQQPVMELNAAGSLMVTSMNEAIGRNRWYETITIAHRDGKFWVYGYTYDWYDTLNLDDQGSCDVNLATGKGTLDLGEQQVRREITTSMRRVPLSDWTGQRPPECGL